MISNTLILLLPFNRLFQQDTYISTQHIDGKVENSCLLYTLFCIARLMVTIINLYKTLQPVDNRAKICGICLGEDPKHSVTNNNLWEVPGYQGSALQIPDP